MCYRLTRLQLFMSQRLCSTCWQSIWGWQHNFFWVCTLLASKHSSKYILLTLDIDGIHQAHSIHPCIHCIPCFCYLCTSMHHHTTLHNLNICCFINIDKLQCGSAVLLINHHHAAFFFPPTTHMSFLDPEQELVWKTGEKIPTMNSGLLGGKTQGSQGSQKESFFQSYQGEC
jgi:hypothetical protein